VTSATLLGGEAAREGAGAPPLHLRRGVIILAAAAAASALAIMLAPGLSSFRSGFSGAELWLILIAAWAEALSCVSYVLVFRSVFGETLDWRACAEIGFSEQAANSLLSAGGAGGLALGAWAMRRAGMRGKEIGGLTVAFFLLTSLANVGFLVLAGAALFSGAVSGPPERFLLGGVPALIGVTGIGLALLVGVVARFGARHRRDGVRAVAESLEHGLAEARGRVASPLALIGSAGYMLFDVAVLAICFPAFGFATPPLDALLLAYLIGQLGGLLPLPAGIGGLDLGLVGALALYGSSATEAAVAVVAYRCVQLAVPTILGLPAFAVLRRHLGAATSRPAPEHDATTAR